MAGRVDGKVVVITGAGSSGPGWGNGKASAVLYAREGAKVVAVDRDSEAAEDTRKLIEEEGGICEIFVADVSNSAEIKAMTEFAVDAFGRIDILHNNVGILEMGGAIQTSEESWNRVITVNQTSVFLTCKHVIPQMLRQGKGSIVNLSSVAGIRWLGLSYVAYAASKAAVISLTQSVAMEYAGRGIRANCVLPGIMDTPMGRGPVAMAYGQDDFDRVLDARREQIPMEVLGSGWDTAYAALFLASDEARYITGAQLVVDGGLSVRCNSLPKK